ncbi:MAG: M48 family metallopeptidase [Myxococcota bacterium]
MRRVLVAFGLALGAACATSSTGRKQLLLFPEGQMSQLGAEAFVQMKAQEPTQATTSKESGYVRCIANALLAAGGLDRNQQWEVVVFESDQVNAFALPGGKIGVYSGMIDFAQDQDQLAAVMGHEIGHVIEQHGNERVSQQSAASGVSALLGSVINAENDETGQLVMAGLGLGFQFGVALPHSRTQEEEADVVGLKLLARAGFDPSGAPKLWQKMASRGSGGPEFLSTHPDPNRRARYLTEMQSDVKATFQAARRAGKNPRCPRS